MGKTTTELDTRANDIKDTKTRANGITRYMSIKIYDHMSITHVLFGCTVQQDKKGNKRFTTGSTDKGTKNRLLGTVIKSAFQNISNRPTEKRCNVPTPSQPGRLGSSRNALPPPGSALCDEPKQRLRRM